MSEDMRFAALDEADQKLIEGALSVSARAYSLYSHFAVGAAIRTTAGRIIAGANYENASYPQGICAEVCAIAKANSEGESRYDAIAIVGHKHSHPQDAGQIVTPCGRCRQVIFEAAQISGTDIKVFSCSGDLTKISVAPISELLPSPFGPANLGLDKKWPAMRRELENTVLRLQESIRRRAGG